MSRNIIAVITDVMGDRVVVEDNTLYKAFKHLELPADILLELLERVLKDPSDIFLEYTEESRKHYMFYRQEHGRYLIAVVKKIAASAFLCTMHTTGKRIRNKHKLMERIK